MDNQTAENKPFPKSKKWFLPLLWFKILIILVLSLSIAFRFIDLDQKVYTTDEVRGLLRVVGYTAQEFNEQVYDGETISAQEIQNYQKPNSEKKLSNTLKALSGNPEHPPLYYLMSRLSLEWLQEPGGARVLSALISLFISPALYWLCLELFDLPLSGWVAIALTAVSPFYLMLAQEARQYSLWTVLIVISSASLLRGLRTLSVATWATYAAAIALGLYTHLFFVFVLLTHGLYVFATERFKDRTTFSYLFSSFVGCITFIPWAWVIVSNSGRVKSTTSWVASLEISLLDRFSYWQANLSSIFLDFNDLHINQLISYIILIPVSYSIYFLYRHTPRKVWLFIFLLISVTALAQVIPDLLWGGRRSLLSRYLVPSYLGIHLAIAYLLTQKLFNIPKNAHEQQLWRGVFALLISVGIISCAASAQARDWWKGASSINLQVAPLVNQVTRPLIISDTNLTFILPLSYLLEPEVQLQLFEKEKLDEPIFQLKIDESMRKFEHVFLYSPSSKLLDQIKQKPGRKITVVVGNSQWFKDRNFLYQVDQPIAHSSGD